MLALSVHLDIPRDQPQHQQPLASVHLAPRLAPSVNNAETLQRFLRLLSPQETNIVHGEMRFTGPLDIPGTEPGWKTLSSAMVRLERTTLKAI